MISTYVTITISPFLNCLPHKHVCEFQVHDTTYVTPTMASLMRKQTMKLMPFLTRPIQPGVLVNEWSDRGDRATDTNHDEIGAGINETELSVGTTRRSCLPAPCCAMLNGSNEPTRAWVHEEIGHDDAHICSRNP